MPTERLARTMRRSGWWLLPLAGIASTGGCQQPTPAATTAADGPARIAVVQPRTVVAALDRLGEFSLLRRALGETGMATPLARRPAVTLLAPRDSAFAQLGPEWINARFDPANRTTLATALRQLTLPRILRADELRQMIDVGGGSAVLPGDGGPLTFTRQGDELYVTVGGGKASMGTQEITTDNGNVYVLDHWVGG